MGQIDHDAANLTEWALRKELALFIRIPLDLHI